MEDTIEMDPERKEELQALTEAQALGKLVAFGLRVEVEAFRGFVSATAYVIKSDPKSRKQRYDSEFFARVTEMAYYYGDKWDVADGYSSIMRHLLVAVMDKKEEQQRNGKRK